MRLFKRVSIFLFIALTITFQFRQSSAITYPSEIESASKQYPYVASLWYSDDNGDSWNIFCSGVLIKNDLVLTSANCSRDANESDYKIVAQVGSDTLGPNINSESWIPVSNIWWNPKFSTESYAGDFGFMLLSHSVKSSVSRVLPIPTSAQLIDSNKITKFSFLGWGVDQNGERSPVLQKIILSDQTANGKKFWNRSFNPLSMISAGSYMKERKSYAVPCNGDSGGPLLATIKNRTVLVGLAGWSSDECDESKPAIFTRLSYFLNDIVAGEKIIRIKSQFPSAAQSETLTPKPDPSQSSPAGEITTLIVSSDFTLQGSSLDASQSTNRAIQLYLESIGYTVGNFKIQFQKYDSGTIERGNWDAKKCETNAQVHSLNPTEVAVIGTSNSGCSKIEIPILNTALSGPLLMVSPFNSDPGLTEAWGPNEPNKFYPSGRRNFARVAAVDASQGLAAARFAKTSGIKSVYVLNDGQIYGRGIAAAFTSEARKLGLNVLSMGESGENWNPSQASYLSNFSKIKALNPEMIYLSGVFDNNGFQVVKDKVATLGNNSGVKLMAPDGFSGYPDLSSSAEAQGMYLTYIGLSRSLLEKGDLTGKIPEFAAKYQNRFGAKLIGAGPLYGVAALQIILKAILLSDGSREGILNAVFTGNGITISESESVLGREFKISTLTGDLLHPDVMVGRIASGEEHDFLAISV